MVGKWHAMHALTPRSSRLQASEAREGVAKRDRHPYAPMVDAEVEERAAHASACKAADDPLIAIGPCPC